MIEKYDAPPYQPKWSLNVQIFLLRHRLMWPFNNQFMVITTTGRKTGRKYAVPIGFVADGCTYLAMNLGGASNWFKNALVDPNVILEINGNKIDACAEPVQINTLDQLMVVLAGYQREHPAQFKRTFGVSIDAPPNEFLKIRERVAFMRFYPVVNTPKGQSEVTPH